LLALPIGTAPPHLLPGTPRGVSVPANGPNPGPSYIRLETPDDGLANCIQLCILNCTDPASAC